MRNPNGPGYICDGHISNGESVPATTHVNVWGGIWNGEVSDLCDDHTHRVKVHEYIYNNVRYTKIEENTNA